MSKNGSTTPKKKGMMSLFRKSSSDEGGKKGNHADHGVTSVQQMATEGVMAAMGAHGEAPDSPRPL